MIDLRPPRKRGPRRTAARRDEDASDPIVDSLRDQRPKTRGDCIDGQRPCPWASCRHHTAIEVSPYTGEIKLAHPELEIWELGDTCSLDVADRGPQHLIDIGRVLGCTRERARQVEGIAMRRLKTALREEPEI